MSVDTLEFSCSYRSASRLVTSSKIFVIHSLQSSASEIEDTALGSIFYYFFPKIIFSAEVLTAHLTGLILLCASQVNTAPIHIWQTSRLHCHAYYSVNKNIL